MCEMTIVSPITILLGRYAQPTYLKPSPEFLNSLTFIKKFCPLTVREGVRCHSERSEESFLTPLLPFRHPLPQGARVSLRHPELYKAGVIINKKFVILNFIQNLIVRPVWVTNQTILFCKLFI